MTNNTTQLPLSSFYGLGIAPRLLEALDRLKFTVPTPIQLKAIPIAIEGKDVMGIAQTGTGKTLAFGIPMIQRLAQVKGKGLVILPTRELALQVDEELHKLGKTINLRTAVLIGGQSMQPQLSALHKKPHIIVATPGRLIDHLEQRTVSLHDVRVLVLDEGDRMLDMGFEPQIKRILQTVPKERQTMLFSATMPVEIVKIASAYMKTPLRVEIARSGTAPERLSQEVYMVPKDAKLRLLDKILTEIHGSVLVFSRTKHGAKKIARSVRGMSHTAAEIHSNRSLAQRREALEGFKTGKYRVLVATDIAARGIDVKGIELVLNFDLPDNPEDYVHRIGRTGRAGMEGHAVSFATPDQGGDVRAIERLIRSQLPMKRPSELPPARAVSYADDRPDYGRSAQYGAGRRDPSRSSGQARSSGRQPSYGYGHSKSSSYGSKTSSYGSRPTSYGSRTPSSGGRHPSGMSHGQRKGYDHPKRGSSAQRRTPRIYT
jgi:ATP-dependent RNA helicase RhlE